MKLFQKIKRYWHLRKLRKEYLGITLQDMIEANKETERTGICPGRFCDYYAEGKCNGREPWYCEEESKRKGR